MTTKINLEKENLDLEDLTAGDVFASEDGFLYQLVLDKWRTKFWFINIRNGVLVTDTYASIPEAVDELKKMGKVELVADLTISYRTVGA